MLTPGHRFRHRGNPRPPVEVERVQTGVRLEKRLLKVLKAIAELKDISLGDLIEGIVLHAFEGKTPLKLGSTVDLVVSAPAK